MLGIGCFLLIVAASKHIMSPLPTYALNIAACALVAICSSAPVWANPAAGAGTRQNTQSKHLQELEQCVFGSEHRNLSNEQRLQALEKATLGHPSSGNLTKRLSAVEHVVGSTHSQMMPPVAPRLDTGITGAPAAAPDCPINNTMLRARATEYGAGPPSGTFRNPLARYPMNATYGNYSGGAGGGYYSANVAAPAYQSAANQVSPPMSAQATNNNTNGQAGSNWRTSAHVGMNSVFTAAHFLPGSAGSTLNALHCPLCRLLSF